MEDLNKQQIILLTLLVSFVTSIATGITTVSLLEQAPKGVTQTINQIVERTVEKVVPGEKQIVQVPGKEVTVVVKEEDLVIKAVESVKGSLVHIENKRGEVFLGLGLIVRADGVVVADASIATLAKEYVAVYKGVKYPLTYLSKDLKNGLAFYKLPAESAPVAIPLSLIESVKAGQTIVTVSGVERDVISIGIISSVLTSEVKVGETITKELSGIETTIGASSLLSGTPFVSLDGKLIAIKAGKGENGSDLVTTVNVLKTALEKVQ